jgi:transcriptional regulator with XRE-family HTH domain
MKINDRNLEKDIVANIIKIRSSKGIKQATMAAEMEINASMYSKIENGQLGLSIEKLSKIARCFDMGVVDLITYPKKYIDAESLSDTERKKFKTKVVLHLELDEDKRDEVIKAAFGNKMVEILNE